jgi:hypothetical protein
MTDAGVEAFTPGTIEAVAKAIGELYSGSELTRVLATAKLPDVIGEGTTKWKRLAEAMQQKQFKQRDGRPISSSRRWHPTAPSAVAPPQAPRETS